MLRINLKKIAEDLIPSFYEAGKESIKLSGKNLKITIKKITPPSLMETYWSIKSYKKLFLI